MLGLKREVVFSGQNRNYQYHIKKISQRKWGVILGKFSSMFSLAPEFYRSVYEKNPPRESHLITKIFLYQKI